ncbi:hypothetical protein QR680_009828 [Steinernema hermaphroditum]|uniref:Tetraspanin n=1 Tax=Steinernema hermaphroditum TaxID=289476 RepID=A0AA39ILS7_9BILA|nr:hypothetical protein QR680_009828 [Steinernema hermaphroditum]
MGAERTFDESSINRAAQAAIAHLRRPTRRITRIEKLKVISLPIHSILFMTLTELMIVSSLLTVALYVFLDVPRVIKDFMEAEQLAKNDPNFHLLNGAVSHAKLFQFMPLFACGIASFAVILVKLVYSFFRGASLGLLVLFNAAVVIITTMVIVGSILIYNDVRTYPEDAYGFVTSYSNVLLYTAEKLHGMYPERIDERMKSVHSNLKCCGFHSPTDYFRAPLYIPMRKPPQELGDFRFLLPEFESWKSGAEKATWTNGSIPIAPKSCCPYEKRSDAHCNYIHVEKNGGKYVITKRASIFDTGCITRLAVTLELEALLVLIASVLLVLVTLGDTAFHCNQHLKISAKLDQYAKND